MKQIAQIADSMLVAPVIQTVKSGYILGIFRAHSGHIAQTAYRNLRWRKAVSGNKNTYLKYVRVGTNWHKWAKTGTKGLQKYSGIDIFEHKNTYGIDVIYAQKNR